MDLVGRLLGACAIGAGMVLLACQAPLPTDPAVNALAGVSFTVDRQDVLGQLAKPPVFDWRHGRVTTAEADELRHQAPEPARAAYGLQALSAVSSPLVAASPFNVSNGAVTSASAFDYMHDRAYWVTDNGYLLRYTITSAGTGAPTTPLKFQLKVGAAAQTFKNTMITLSNDGRRVYLCSMEGNFLVIDANTGATRYSYAVGTNAAITNPGAGAGLPPAAIPAPFIDPVASRADGQAETVYVVANSGTSASTATKLHRFVVSQAAAAATPTAVLAQSYDLGLAANGTICAGVRANPVVVAGRAVIGAWARHMTTPSLSTGRVLYFDTACRTATGATVAGAAHAAGSPFTVPHPVWVAPAVDVDNAFVPFFAFVPGAFQVTAVDLRTGLLGYSPPLLVDKATVPTTGQTGTTVNPASSLDNYPYDATAASFKTLEPTLAPDGYRCAMTVSGGATALSPAPTVAASPNTTTRDYDRFYTYARINYGNATPYPSPDPAFAYAMFKYDYADTFVGTETVARAVSHARIVLTATRDSNNPPGGKAGDPTVPGVNGWRVNNALPTGGANWAPTTITPSNRPKFPNGDAVSHAAMVSTNNAHAPEKLVIDTTAGRSNNNASANVYKSSVNPYAWLADGLIAEGAPATFAFYSENDGQGGKNPGQPFQMGSPQFAGGSAANRPKLELELSAYGLGNPSMLCPVTIDSVTQQIFAVNANALFRVSYQNAANANTYNAADIPVRFANMADTQKTFYAHTPLGNNGSYGPIYTLAAGSPAKRYVGNITAPLLTGSKVYVQDVFKNASDAYSRTTVSEFSVGATPNPAVVGTGSAPVRGATVLTLTSAGDEVAGPAYMTYDFESARLLTSTWSPSNAGRLFIINR